MEAARAFSNGLGNGGSCSSGHLGTAGRGALSHRAARSLKVVGAVIMCVIAGCTAVNGGPDQIPSVFYFTHTVFWSWEISHPDVDFGLLMQHSEFHLGVAVAVAVISGRAVGTLCVSDSASVCLSTLLSFLMPDCFC